MNDRKVYDTGLDQLDQLICSRCQEPLILRQITLSYLNSAFPVELPACPVCGQYYIPEDLALGKILHVEKSLEDK